MVLVADFFLVEAAALAAPEAEMDVEDLEAAFAGWSKALVLLNPLKAMDAIDSL